MPLSWNGVARRKNIVFTIELTVLCRFMLQHKTYTIHSYKCLVLFANELGQRLSDTLGTGTIWGGHKIQGYIPVLQLTNQWANLLHNIHIQYTLRPLRSRVYYTNALSKEVLANSWSMYLYQKNRRTFASVWSIASSYASVISTGYNCIDDQCYYSKRYWSTSTGSMISVLLHHTRREKGCAMAYCQWTKQC